MMIGVSIFNFDFHSNDYVLPTIVHWSLKNKHNPKVLYKFREIDFMEKNPTKLKPLFLELKYKQGNGQISQIAAYDMYK